MDFKRIPLAGVWSFSAVWKLKWHHLPEMRFWPCFVERKIEIPKGFGTFRSPGKAPTEMSQTENKFQLKSLLEKWDFNQGLNILSLWVKYSFDKSSSPEKGEVQGKLTNATAGSNLSSVSGFFFDRFIFLPPLWLRIVPAWGWGSCRKGSAEGQLDLRNFIFLPLFPAKVKALLLPPRKCRKQLRLIHAVSYSTYFGVWLSGSF